jgi:hypothetical protein
VGNTPVRFNLSNLHKTMILFEKTETGLALILMDSVNQEGDYARLIYDSIRSSLDHHSELTVYCPKSIEKPIALSASSKDPLFKRQVDFHQCGTIAIKDARQIKQYPDIIAQITRNAKPTQTKALRRASSGIGFDSYEFNILEYDLPPHTFKSVQSTTFAKHIADKYGKTVVSAHGKM